MYLYCVFLVLTWQQDLDSASKLVILILVETGRQTLQPGWLNSWMFKERFSWLAQLAHNIFSQMLCTFSGYIRDAVPCGGTSCSSHTVFVRSLRTSNVYQSSRKMLFFFMVFMMISTFRGNTPVGDPWIPLNQAASPSLIAPAERLQAQVSGEISNQHSLTSSLLIWEDSFLIQQRVFSMFWPPGANHFAISCDWLRYSEGMHVYRFVRTAWLWLKQTKQSRCAPVTLMSMKCVILLGVCSYDLGMLYFVCQSVSLMAFLSFSGPSRF